MATIAPGFAPLNTGLRNCRRGSVTPRPGYAIVWSSEEDTITGPAFQSRREQCRTNFFGLRRLALAAALFGFAASAHAVVEIQWWHSMTGALERPRQRHRQRLQCEPEGLQGRARLQGLVSGIDDGGDRGVPRRQRAAHPAGVRGRHGDDDGGQGRDQAGLRDDEGGQGAVRPEELPVDGGRLLLRQQGQHAVVAVQQLDDAVLRQQGRLQEGGPRSREGAEDLGRVRGGRRPS